MLGIAPDYGGAIQGERDVLKYVQYQGNEV
jgi:hypothetical protein